MTLQAEGTRAGTAFVKPTLRADQVGSLLRPQRLKDARAAHEAGRLTAAGLRAVEDDCIREVVRQQEDAGLDAISDGDFRRSAFHVDFLSRLAGVVPSRRQFTNLFQGLDDADNSPLVFEVTDRIRHTNDIAVADFTFLRDHTRRTAKVALPAPSFVHARGGRSAIDRTAYPDLDAFYDDLAAAYRAEIAALARAGCRYVQLDEVHYTFFCDPRIAPMFAARGDDPQALGLAYARLINESFRDQPAMISGVHLCRGNRQSAWVAAGGYEPVAEVLFNEIRADRFLLEFDDDRSGGFEPLRFVPRGKIVVLGLVTSKRSELETADALKRDRGRRALRADRATGAEPAMRLRQFGRRQPRLRGGAVGEAPADRAGRAGCVGHGRLTAALSRRRIGPCNSESSIISIATRSRSLNTMNNGCA